MKKIIFTLILSYTSFSYSQDIGFHFGGNLANQLNKNRIQKNSEEFNYKNVFGINIGFDYKKKLSNNRYLLTGLSFIQNGFESDRKNFSDGSTYLAKSAKLNYLSIPLLLLLDSPKTKIGPNLKFGGYISYLVGGDYSVENYPYETPLDEKFQKLDFGLTGGIGIKYNRFTLDFIFNLGLNNIAEDGDNDFIETNIKNRSLNMNLIYWIK
tara:strand:+ start:81 stop:710 length:630 start_codon:yes stop_codon:yes gene_type:complete